MASITAKPSYVNNTNRSTPLHQQDTAPINMHWIPIYYPVLVRWWWMGDVCCVNTLLCCDSDVTFSLQWKLLKRITHWGTGCKFMTNGCSFWCAENYFTILFWYIIWKDKKYVTLIVLFDYFRDKSCWLTMKNVLIIT